MRNGYDRGIREEERVGETKMRTEKSKGEERMGGE